MKEKYKIAVGVIIILLSVVRMFAQEVELVEKGYYKVMIGDSLVSNHTKQFKAVEKALNEILTGREDVYILPPSMIILDAILPNQTFPMYVPEIANADIEILELTSTSVKMMINHDLTNVAFFYVQFYSDGETIQQTSRALDQVQSFKQLKPLTIYYYTIYFGMVDGSVKASNILSFKTL